MDEDEDEVVSSLIGSEWERRGFGGNECRGLRMFFFSLCMSAALYHTLFVLRMPVGTKMLSPAQDSLSTFQQTFQTSDFPQ